MLIVLRKEEYPRDDAQRAAWRACPEFDAFLDHLADSLKSRAHAVEASPKLLEWMAGCEGLSEPQRRALGEASAFNQRRELPLKEVSHALLLTGPLGASADPKGICTTWIRRDWSWFARRDGPLRKAALVAENINDSDLYVWVGRAMGARLRPAEGNAGDEVAFDCVHGGGNTTGQVYERQVVEKGSPTLCVVDADKKYPEGSAGETAEAVHAAERSRLTAQELAPHAVVTLEAYTVENIVPLELVRLSCKDAKGTSFDWVEPMARRGFFLWQTPSSEEGFKRAFVDPALKYINPDPKLPKDSMSPKGSAKMLRDSAGKDQQLLRYREAAINRIRELDRDAPKDDEGPLVMSVGKLPQDLVKKLEELRDPKRRPGKHPSAAHWLCSQLRKSPDAFADEWEPVARAVWSWGLRFPQTIRERPPTR
jgi:hypothetical protein